MKPSGASVLVQRRRAALGGVAACVLLALVALLVIRSGDGPSRADLGDQADPSSVGAAVDAAIGAGERGALPTESSTMCAAETRGSYGQGLGSLVYSARLRWQGVAAMALAYRVTGAQTAGLDHRVFVVSIAGCQLLVAQSL